MRQLATILLLLTTLPTSAQVRHYFEGLARTRVQYIGVESDVLTAAPGTTDYLLDITGDTTTAHLQDIRQSLVNLPAIVEATYELRLPTTEPGTSDPAPIIIIWTIREGRTIFPLINFGGIRGNSFYQIGFNDIHFRGRGQELTGFYQNNDGEHNYLLLLRNQAYRGSRWGYLLEARRYAAVEPVYFPETAVNYRYLNQSYGAGLSYTLPARRRFTLGLTTFRERYRKTDEELARSTPGPEAVDQRKFLLKTGFTHDRLDQHEERVSGSHHQTSAQAVLTRGQQERFLIAWHDWRYYRLLGPAGNLAARLRTGISSNGETPFAPFVLDSQVNIRGSGNRIDRGTAQLVLNLEYRHRIWRERRGRLAVQLVGFSDLGTWRNPGGRLADLWERESVRHFVGGGVRLVALRAQGAVLRFDYGVDVGDRRARGFVAGFGQYF